MVVHLARQRHQHPGQLFRESRLRLSRVSISLLGKTDCAKDLSALVDTSLPKEIRRYIFRQRLSFVRATCLEIGDCVFVYGHVGQEGLNACAQDKVL